MQDEVCFRLVAFCLGSFSQKLRRAASAPTSWNLAIALALRTILQQFLVLTQSKGATSLTIRGAINPPAIYFNTNNATCGLRYKIWCVILQSKGGDDLVGFWQNKMRHVRFQRINVCSCCISWKSRVVGVGLSLAMRLPEQEEFTRAEEYEWTLIHFLKESNTSTKICPHLSAPFFDMAGAACFCFASNFHCFYSMKGGTDNSACTSPCKKQYNMHFAVASLHFASEALWKSNILQRRRRLRELLLSLRRRVRFFHKNFGGPRFFFFFFFKKNG